MFARAARRTRAHARRAARMLNQDPAGAADEEVQILISSVEDLIERLGKIADPELRRLRTQTEAALVAARAALAEGSAQALDRAQTLAEQGDAYVRERPWSSVGVAALCVLALGVWAGRAMTTD